MTRRKKAKTTVRKAKVRKPPGIMNDTEQWYYDKVLMPKVDDGTFAKVLYEPFRFVLADKSTYLPDFYVLRSDGEIEIHETKGYWREDDRVKIKVAASKFPEFHWYGIRISGGVSKKIVKLEKFGP